MRAFSGFKVIRIDLPGNARSSGVPGALSIQRFVDSVVAVCRQLGVGSAHFVGHSLGTIVCQHLATQRAGLVKSLALFGPLMCPPDAARPNIQARAHKAASEGAIGMQAIADAIAHSGVIVFSVEIGTLRPENALSHKHLRTLFR